MKKTIRNQRQADDALDQFARRKEADGMAIPTRSIYGRTSIFDPCASGDIFGLQTQVDGFMQWIGWRPNQFYRRRVDFVPWWGPEGTEAGTQSTGAVGPCADPPGWEYGKAGYELLHKSWYGRSGEALDPHTVGMVRCETSPRYRLNGVQITDDVEWQMNGITQVLQQSIKRDLVHGSHLNAYEMDGLESIIKTGYTDDNGNLTPELDSKLITWGGDNLDGEVNGLGNYFDYLDELVTEIEYLSSPLGTIAPEDMALVTTRFMATGLLNAYACYSTCGVTDTSDITDQALRAQQRQERRSLNEGPLFDGNTAVGHIPLKSGRSLPILVTDTIDISKAGSNYAADGYLLTRRIGARDVLYGEYLDLRNYENAVKKSMPDFRARSDAAGRFLIKGKEDNFCVKLIMGTSPELYLSAPWAQARFIGLATPRKRQPLTKDPFQPLYGPSQGWLYNATSYE